jgi:PAS domain S-box-containing protein
MRLTIPQQRESSEPRGPLLVTDDEEQPTTHALVTSARDAVLLTAATALAVYLLGSLAIDLRPEGSTVAAWWPASGVAVAAVAICDRRWRPLVLAGVGTGALAASISAERSWLLVVGFTAADVLTAFLWTLIMTRGHDESPRLHTAEDFGRFVVATLGATGAAGLVAGISTQLAGVEGLLTTWAAFVATQSASVLILVPFALRLPAPVRRPHPLEVGIQATALVGSILLVFGPDQLLPLGVLPLPFLVWGAVRLPVRWVAVELLVAGILLSILTTAGEGPFAAITDEGFDPELTGVLLQVTLLAYVVVTLPLALLVHRQASALTTARNSYQLVQSVLTGATGTAIMGCGRSGTISFFNVGAEQMLGWPAEDVVGTFSLDRFHAPEEIESRAEELGVPPGLEVLTASVARGAPSERRDWTLVRRNGTRLTVSLRVTARMSEDGELLGYLAVGEDVTDRHRTETALRDALDREREALDRLGQLDKAKTNFVSTVSHELRTPMTSILGYTDMVLSETAGPVTAEQRGMLETARRNGRRLLRLIEDLLTVSLIEDGRFTIDVEPVDLRAAAQGAVEAVKPLLVDRHLDLQVYLGSRQLTVVGDLDHLERVAINLLANAVKFTPDGGRVVVRVGACDKEAILEVSDTGIGIPEDEQSQLFERFFRSTNAQELEVPGTGLGLAIVQTIVSSHRGEITVRSRPREGTTFRVAIPLRQPAPL